MEYDQKHTDEAAPNTHLDELPGIGDHRRREQQRLSHLDEPLAEGDIFQNQLIGKSAEPFKECTADKERLIAVNNTAADATKII